MEIFKKNFNKIKLITLNETEKIIFPEKIFEKMCLNLIFKLDIDEILIFKCQLLNNVMNDNQISIHKSMWNKIINTDKHILEQNKKIREDIVNFYKLLIISFSITLVLIYIN